jgi:dTDP-L-rhamnose 4-epimerase
MDFLNEFPSAVPDNNDRRVKGMKTILITGGAGFIGAHVTEELIMHGYEVRVLDNLSPQVHGPDRLRPVYLHPDAELITGDVRDPEIVRRALSGIDAVFHFAAMVGVGQSMYEMEKYTSTNNTGTAVLLEALLENPVERLIVASSMSIYGEGLCRTEGGRISTPLERTAEQFERRDWELTNIDQERLRPSPTPETKLPQLASVYALSKYHQERMCLIFGNAYGIETVGLRFFNVFGKHQSLSNPYTGVLAIFASRILNGNPPLIYEDGKQMRDFVHVKDVAVACRLALEKPEADGMVFNIGSGQPRTILSISEQMTNLIGEKKIRPKITYKYRIGDIRHCFADIKLAARILGYVPQVPFQQGLLELASWLGQQKPKDYFSEAETQLEARRLTL